MRLRVAFIHYGGDETIMVGRANRSSTAITGAVGASDK